ncbi:DUF885 domain-containing protein [Adhaeretor mobilis]|uniref:DUF885 domain-containing protein n=1 Tax=Adhaeretor mobilis TaxID=1930276 RepID=A0A517N286_9BACT|nr:DUF885 domain-containing protein [Adhaeretor mobilis]QDT01235.1 hypothetical protein HG15A2_45770 [Adhaeretor mobilis]
MSPAAIRSLSLCFTLLLSCATSVRADTSADFAQLLEDSWEYDMQEFPQWATSAGDHRYNDKLEAISLADARRRNESTAKFLKRLEALDRSQLAATEQVNYDIFARQLRESLAEFKFGNHLLPITNRSGFHVSFPELRRDVPLESTRDYENYVARLQAFGEYANGYMELMRVGIDTEKTVPAVILQGYEPTIDTHIVDDPEKSLLYEPLEAIAAAVPESEHERLRTAAKEAIAESVVPGYRRFAKFMKNEYVPAARGSIGASALPDGRDFYRHRVRRFTTLDQTPEEVHQIGLAEVKRIRSEMDGIIQQVGFDGDFAAFTTYLRTDPQFYAPSAEQLMKEAAAILKKADGELPKLFGKLPRTPYGLREVPEYNAPRTTAAYYQRPAGDGTKAGFFYLNTFNIKSRPLYTLEALALHEAVPGHHLQLALQQEIEGMPKFRRFADFTAYIEGWALYSERLGREIGFYKDPYSDFGRLTMEIWRASRLVVDTGIHYMGWTRKQAIDYLHENSAMSLHNITAEIDRYIGWPGQALGYKTGELKIRALRAQAEEALGEKFDIRSFHDMVLASGAIPLDVLEANVQAWIEKQSK